MSAMSASMISSIVWMMNLIAKSKKGLLKFGSFKYSPYLCSVRMPSEGANICFYSRTSSWTFLTIIRGHSREVMSSVFQSHR